MGAQRGIQVGFLQSKPFQKKPAQETQTLNFQIFDPKIMMVKSNIWNSEPKIWIFELF